MPRKPIFSAPANQIQRLAALAVLFLLAGPSAAFADRIVYFEALGHSEIIDGGVKLGYYDPANGANTGASTLQAKCKFTITNSGPSDQKITVSVTGTATGTATAWDGSNLTDIATSSSPVPTAKDQDNASVSWPISSYVLLAGKQVTVQMLYPAPHYLAKSSQDIRCTGSIIVTDNVVSSPGFVVANGMISTWAQSSSAFQSAGTGKMRAEVQYYYTPFSIGGGRAF